MYHAAKSGGTGRGYICAVIPLETYKRLCRVVERYPTFVLPLPRASPDAPDGESAHEFFFMQWAMHNSPPLPTPTEPDPFEAKNANKSSPNPPTSTLLFTPLQEYKLRGEFATPHLALTMHTDLAQTHNVVLMRGEITPSTVSSEAGEMKYLLTQEDAQLLGVGMQKFYLWEGEGEGKRLLKTFHERPEDFKWEELLAHSKIV